MKPSLATKKIVVTIAVVIVAAFGIWSSFRARYSPARPGASIAPVAPSTAGDSPILVPTTTEIPAAVTPLVQTERLEAPQFSVLTQNVASALPTKRKHAKSLAPAEVEHGVPASLLQAAEKLGKVKEAVVANPELEGDAVTFYRTCALNRNLIDAVRALCLVNHRDLQPRHPMLDPIDETLIPANVRRVANSLKP